MTAARLKARIEGLRQHAEMMIIIHYLHHGEFAAVCRLKDQMFRGWALRGPR